ncbi:hypothetical protein PMAYCL1PPCAC_07423, partial [Pristionchus mayeri]
PLHREPSIPRLTSLLDQDRDRRMASEDDSSQHGYSSPDSTINSSFHLMPLTRVIKSELSIEDEEEVVVDDEHLLVDHEEDIITQADKQYVLLPKSSEHHHLHVSIDKDGVDDSLLDSASSLGAYAVSNNSGGYSSTDFTMDAYALQGNNSIYLYPEASAYQAYYTQYPTTMPSPTSSTSYIITSNLNPASPSSEDDTDRGDLGMGGQGGTRAHPETITWLKANYEKADGSSLPRCTLYHHYKSHCAQHRLEPVNAASFGKLIRSIFDGLKTRRLGTRGNSKYHYYGIRMRPNSSLAAVQQHDFQCDPPPPTRSAIKSSSSTRRGMVTRSNTSPTSSTISRPGSAAAAATPVAPSSISLAPAASSRAAQPAAAAVEYQHGAVSSSEDQHKANLGNGLVAQYTILSTPETDLELRAVGLSMEHAHKFVDAYYQNCQDVLYAVKELRFDGVEDAWKRFWQYEEVSTGPHSITPDVKIALCSVQAVKRYITIMDFTFLQMLCDVLVPDLLAQKSQISEALNLRMRNFAKVVESIAKISCEGAPIDVVRRKEIAARMMSQTLRKYTSLAHLSYAARQVCDSADGTSFLAEDLTRVDLAVVQEQCEWVASFRCDPDFVRQLTDSFKDNLAKKKSLDEWADWMEAVVDQILAKYHDRPHDEMTRHAKGFLLNWSFFSSMVIRDLTLRSAHSFGHFHLLRLLFDEYLLYLVETKLAKSSDRPILAIRAENLLHAEDLAMFDLGNVVKIEPHQGLYPPDVAAYLSAEHHFMGKVEVDDDIDM